jgi:serine O-acetyltransferase
MRDKPQTKDVSCKLDVEMLAGYRDRLPQIAQKIIDNCGDEECYNHVDFEPIPSKDAVVKIINKFLEIVFPGFFSPEKLDPVNLRFNMGQCVTQFFSMLSEQVVNSIRHDCFRYELSCQECNEKGHEIALKVLEKMPLIRKILATDVRGGF